MRWEAAEQAAATPFASGIDPLQRTRATQARGKAGGGAVRAAYPSQQQQQLPQSEQLQQLETEESQLPHQHRSEHRLWYFLLHGGRHTPQVHVVSTQAPRSNPAPLQPLGCDVEGGGIGAPGEVGGGLYAEAKIRSMACPTSLTSNARARRGRRNVTSSSASRRP